MRTLFRRYILESATWKTAVWVLGTVVVAVLSGAFIVEITRNGEVAWKQFYHSASFYGLLAIGVLMFFYNREVYLYERDILRFKDSEYCMAYVRSKCIPAAVEVYEARIRAGDIGELEEAMNEVRRILQ